MPRPFDLLPPLLEGLSVTVQVAACGAALAIVCALLAGLGRLSRDPIVRAYARVYVEVFRGTSALVQLFWFYFALPILLGVRLDAFTVGVLVLGLNIGAYGAEVVRGAIIDVPRGQIQAAAALNLTRCQTMRYVVLPQAVVAMLPPMGNLLIELLKGTALVSMITLSDLTRIGLFLRDDTLRTVEIFGLLLAIYFGLSLLITVAVRGLERRFSRGLDYGGAR
ncbi:MAG: ectoine/hydroxyectoine ABC transporter permease subunit EhuC [Planctomycetes bacterium]|nr:ectoine/hydroxyectoine ABC transporter permease subunit EhuC [Planctomycetota bacterium]